MLYTSPIIAQNDCPVESFTGIVYDENFSPIPYTHVVALVSGEGDVTDRLGIFELNISPTDTLLFYNISFQNSTVEVNQLMDYFYIKLKPRIYPLNGVRIFEWGSSYEDMLTAFREISDSTEMGESLGLQRRDPDYVPFNMDEKRLKSAKFLFTSPVSYFYYNYSRHAKNARKAYKLKRNESSIRQFNELLSPDNIKRITGYKGGDLTDFMLYLNKNMQCDYHCNELETLTEVHLILKKYREISKKE